MTKLIRFCRNVGIAIFGTCLLYYIVACGLAVDAVNPLSLAIDIREMIQHSDIKKVSIISCIFIFIFTSALTFVCYADYWQQRYGQEKREAIERLKDYDSRNRKH